MKASTSTLRRQAWKMWEEHAETYRNLRKRYDKLLREKEALGIEPKKKLCNSVWRELPNIHFFTLYKGKAKKYLDGLSRIQIWSLIYRIENTVGSIEKEIKPCYEYTMITERIKYFEMQIERKKNPEDYKDLVVRVAGFSAYFVEVFKESQDDLIRRTEMVI